MRLVRLPVFHSHSVSVSNVCVEAVVRSLPVVLPSQVRLSKYTAAPTISFHKEPESFELALIERDLSFTTPSERSAAPLRACV
jgi:hypothetical protein